MELIEKDGKRAGFIRRNFTDDEFEEIKSLTPFIKDESRKSIRERVYCLLNGIAEIPKCKVCGRNNHFLCSGKYSATCSQSCGIKNPDTQKRTKETHLIRYGVKRFTNPDKAKNTCLERYGVEHTSKLEENRQMANETWLERHGVEGHNELIRKGFIKKYGVDNVWKSPEIIERISIKRAKRYQARRNDEGTDYKGTVYILYFSNYDAIKIGLTSDFESRSKALNKDFGEFEILELIETDACYRLEKRFHDELDSYRICLGEGTGRTEFFSIECKDDLKDVLNEM